MFRQLGYMDVLNQDLKVMDATAVALCKDNNMDIIVFDVASPGNVKRAVLGEEVGTLVTASPAHR
jgi:uridylate kinase